MKILITAEYSDTAIEELKELFDQIEYDPWTEYGRGLSAEEINDRLKDGGFDALITELDDISEMVLRTNCQLKFIGDCRGNPANINVTTAKELGIPVFYTPARNAQAVAELLVGMLIAFYRNVLQAVDFVKAGKWIEPPPSTYYKFQGNEICGKLIGFVGFGQIARKTYKIVDAFGADTMYYDPYVDEGYCRKAELAEIFRFADVVSVNLPVTPETRGLINAELLGSMKPDAVLINTARSAVIDYKALYEILQSKKIRGAILDVFDKEPPQGVDLELISLNNVLSTPHICGATFEVVNHQSEILNAQIKKYFNL